MAISQASIRAANELLAGTPAFLW